jgi:hypothetical protein
MMLYQVHSLCSVNDGVMCDWSIEKAVKGSSHGLFQGIIPGFAEENQDSQPMGQVFEAGTSQIQKNTNYWVKHLVYIH